MASNPDAALLEIDALRVHFHTDQGTVRALDGISLIVREGGTLGIVGESGCGKSVTARAIMGLLPENGEVAGGRIVYNPPGEVPIDITAMQPNGSAMRSLRGNKIAMIFQEPLTSLSPVYTVGAQIMEAIMRHTKLPRRDARERTIELLRRVNIPAPEKRIDAYPHHLSGGMRQRVMIAMAISCSPKLLIADEPTTALDVTIEAQILELLKKMQFDEGASLIIISHDLGVIAETADNVAVMYVGRIVETGTAAEVLHDPLHPYTRALLRSIPIIGRSERLEPVGGTVPTLYELPRGCKFAPRCGDAMDICHRTDPPATMVGKGRDVRCWLYDKEARAVS
jgi:oligopeptide/dipeptide ABC transporter ATP-binding protein